MVGINLAHKKTAPEGNGSLEEKHSTHRRFPTLVLTRSGSKGCLLGKTLSRAAPLAVHRTLNRTLRRDLCQSGLDIWQAL